MSLRGCVNLSTVISNINRSVSIISMITMTTTIKLSVTNVYTNICFNVS